MKKRIISLVICLSLIFSVYSLKTNADTTIYGAGYVSTDSSGLIIRKSASKTAAPVGSLNKGDYVTLVSKSGSWWKVEYQNDKYGYCSADYITVQSTNVGFANTKSTSLLIRSGAGSKYPVIGSFQKGENFAVLSKGSSWSKVLFYGTQIGYVSSSYVGSKSTAYSSVTLNVSDYKQTDPKWANVKLGSSSKTISKSGCVVCCLANTESYRKGTSVTPKYLATNLKFTSDGSVYWPSNYVFYSNSNYLSVIYNKLKAGIPVIIGAKSSSRSHYVTVYGFKESSNLTADKFLIKDPGSSTTTTLKQFLDSYPTFIKLVYYN